MNARIERLWPRRPAEGDLSDGDVASPDPSEADDVAPAVDESLTEVGAVEGPEQPVLLTPVGPVRQVHVGDVLPPARRGLPALLPRLPAVPKRAILAVGVCAGLVAPTLARHLAARLLLGPSAPPAGGTLEITRIVYNGPLTPRALSAICQVLRAARR